MGNSSGRGVLEGAFSLLEALKTAEEAGLTSLASGSGLPKSTTHRLLEQLVEIGAVERSAGSYRMGPRMFRLGQAWQPCPGLLLAKVREPIRRLACATRTTVGVCVLSEGRTLLVASVPGGVEELASMRPGSTCPWPTAAGKVLVAGVNPQIPLGPLPPGWPQEAAEIRDRGIAFDRQEQLAGVCCTAVPLRGSAGQTVAALCVLTNPARQVPQLAEAVTRAGRIISRQLRR